MSIEEKLDRILDILEEQAQYNQPVRIRVGPGAIGTPSRLATSPRTGVPGGPPQFGAPAPARVATARLRLTEPVAEGDWQLPGDSKVGEDID